LVLLVFANALLFLMIVAIFSFYIYRSVYTPAFFYAGSWLLNLCVYYLVMNNYDQINQLTWLLVFGSFVSFIVGFFFAGVIQNPAGKVTTRINFQEYILNSTNPKKFKRAIWLVLAVGGLPFCLYAYSFLNTIGFEGFSSLLQARAYMKTNGPFLGFHYFYFWELLLPLYVFYAAIFVDRRDKLLLCFVLIGTSLLVMTGAKTNVFKAIMFAFFVLFFLKMHRFGIVRNALIFGIVAISMISMFFVHTKATGEVANLDAQVQEVVARFSLQFNTFDKLVHDDTVNSTYGGLLFAPVLKVADLGPVDIHVPSHILDFYYSPKPFNLATYLDVFYKDFGILGIIIMPFLFGLVCAFVFIRFMRGNSSPFFFFLTCALTLSAIGSVNTSSFVKPSWWFQLFVFFLISRYVCSRKNLAAKTV